MLVLKTKYQKLSRVVFAPNSHGLAAAGQKGAYWWRSVLDDPKPARLGDKECVGIGFSPDGAHLVYLPTGLGVCAIQLAFAAPKYSPDRAAGSSLTVCPTTGLAVAERWTGGEMTGYRVGSDGTPVTIWTTNTEPGSIGSSVAFAPDGSWFVRAALDNESRVNKYRFVRHDAATGKEVGGYRGDVWVSAGPTISPNGEWIAYASGNMLRSQSTSKLQHRESSFNENTHQYTDLAFHPSGRFLAATNNDETVKLYDTTTWEVARTFTWDIGRMRSVAFSPDGTLAAAGSDKGKVVVWDVDV